jgi:hypothetical protein
MSGTLVFHDRDLVHHHVVAFFDVMDAHLPILLESGGSYHLPFCIYVGDAFRELVMDGFACFCLQDNGGSGSDLCDHTGVFSCLCGRCLFTSRSLGLRNRDRQGGRTKDSKKYSHITHFLLVECFGLDGSVSFPIHAFSEEVRDHIWAIRSNGCSRFLKNL